VSRGSQTMRAEGGLQRVVAGFPEEKMLASIS